jgi:hypothetical protein
MKMYIIWKYYVYLLHYKLSTILYSSTINGFRLHGNFSNFLLTVDRKYYQQHVASNKVVDDVLCSYSGAEQEKAYWAVNFLFVNLPEQSFDSLLEFFKHHNFKYSLALGPVKVSMYDKNQILVTGYLKPKVIQALTPFQAKLIYLPGSEEGYLFPLSKYSNVILLLNRRRVVFTDLIANLEVNFTETKE